MRLIAILFAVYPCTAFASPDTIRLNVLSATVRDKPVANAEVIFQRNGQSSVTYRTDSRGVVLRPRPFGVNDDDSVHLIIRAPGYSTLVAKCPCANLTYALSESMTQLDGIRIVLSWGARPLDLDAHLVWPVTTPRPPQNHVYFFDKQGDGAKLDVDSRLGYGPETITIDRKEPGVRYRYAVDTFRNAPGRLGAPIPAMVNVYIGNSLVKTFDFVPAPEDNVLVLFDIDELGVIHPINRAVAISDRRVESQTIASLGATPQIPLPASNNHGHANDLNRAGETAYHRGDLEKSITLYREAIDAYPNFGQAYSNLGLAYQKNGQIAEAIWANRMAISLANGLDAERVRANSYYNIGRIYESRGHWNDALYNYRFAHTWRPSATYAQAVARMNKKLAEVR